MTHQAHWRRFGFVSLMALLVLAGTARAAPGNDPAPLANTKVILIVVKDTLLPEISNEVARLQADMTNEGYTPKLKSWSSGDASNLWTYIKSEYDTPGQTVEGAILIGYLPSTQNTSTSETTDCAIMNMTNFRNVSTLNIWVSRIWATDSWGNQMSPGQVFLIKRYLQANHDCRTGVHRLPYTAYWAMLCYPESTGSYYPNNGTNGYLVWPTVVQTGDLHASLRQGGDVMDETGHGEGGSYGNYTVSGSSINSTLAQIRYGLITSCSSGAWGGVVNRQIFTRGGGNIFSVGASATAYTGAFVVFNDTTFLNRLKTATSWGAAINGGYPFDDRYRAIFYGDLSLPVKPTAANQMPVISVFTNNVITGSAPLTVNFAVTASDPDGSISNYEWFVDGHWYGEVNPTHSGASVTNISHIYTLPHRYLARVEVMDNYKARAWQEKEIIVGPAPGQPLRVNCDNVNNWIGNNYDYVKKCYRPGADYTATNGDIWLHDQEYIAGTWGLSGTCYGGYVEQPVANTTDPALYKVFRTSSSMTYRVPVTNGGYWLNLGFADMQSSGAGQRVMDVEVEGALMVSGLDVYSQVGGRSAMTVSLYTEVTDGELTFTVEKNVSSPNDAFINCFEVIPYAGGNRPPMAQSQGLMTMCDTPKSVALSAIDPDGDTLTYSVVVPPAHGTLSGVAPNLVYTPATGYVGSDAFTFRANDGTADGSVAAVSLTVCGLQARWKLDDGSGTNAVDSTTGSNTATLVNGPTWTGSGRLGGALVFDGASNYLATSVQQQGPNVFSQALWFKTTTAAGGKMIGFGGSRTGQSGSYDRHLYMDNAGKVYFGVYNGSVQTVCSTSALNDGVWHHAVGVLSSAGIALYVDGIKVASNVTVTSAQPYAGHWRIGYDTVGSWPSAPSSYYFNGTLDDVRVYNYGLSAAEAATLASGSENRSPTIGSLPSASPNPAWAGNSVNFTAAATDPDGDPLIYSWVFGDGGISSEQNPSHTYASCGTYVATVVVSDGKGGSASDTAQVTIYATSYTITATAGTGGTITPSGPVAVSHGASQAFAVAANTGYSILDLKVDGVTKGALSGYTFTNVMANHTITATFVPPITSMTARVACDNAYDIYLNGTLLGSGNNWQQMQIYNAGLVGGKNVVAIRGVDQGGAAALLAEVVIGLQTNSSSSGWKLSRTLAAGWETTDFDDSTWGGATDYGAYGISPWGTGISGWPSGSAAHWIWSSDNNNDDTIYVRFTFTNGISTDAYGIPDSWKVQYFGSANATNADGMCDADGDGMNNYGEWKAGTNPTNSASLLKFAQAAQEGGSLVLSWQSVAGKFYTIRKGTNLFGGFPVLVATNIPGTVGMNVSTLLVNQAAEYYKVKVE
ncbi:MAG: hypothetical protein C0404_09550 [Verrucomicrobia bacterium]|nr:hypothetical protein [Verrucomicrobiota bacterium]